jgi:hypothetical protein
MAWRIADYIERGEIDNRTKDRITGTIHLCGLDAPIHLELTGNPYRDLAGQLLRFINPKPKPIPEHLADIATEQTGVVGDMTAARKVKILDIEDGELKHYYLNKIPMPYHWGNSVYLEWHSVLNGRVVIESADYQLEVLPEATWQMSETEEAAQLEANGRAMINFMNQMLGTVETEALEDLEADDDPQSEAEAEADSEAARMDLLNDRIMARLEKDEQANAEDYARIVAEERERLRRERGEPERSTFKPADEADRPEWIDAHNADFEEAMAREGEPPELEADPLFEHCQELGFRVRENIEQNAWLPEDAQEEHPLNALQYGIWSASAKLAGALNGRGDEWPPEPLFAGDCLVRLKKARGYLQDALRGQDAADAEKLADPIWLQPLREELLGILNSVQSLIDEVRAVLKRNDGTL